MRYYNQLVDILDKKLQADSPTVESVKAQELPYLQQVLDETLRYIKIPTTPSYALTTTSTHRLYPSVPFDFRKCIADDVWPDGKHIPKGVRAHNPISRNDDN